MFMDGTYGYISTHMHLWMATGPVVSLQSDAFMDWLSVVSHKVICSWMGPVVVYTNSDIFVNLSCGYVSSHMMLMDGDPGMPTKLDLCACG